MLPQRSRPVADLVEEAKLCNGPCPAIANAIYDAVGVPLRETPVTPERVLAAIQAKKG